MNQQDVTGALAHGRRYRATSYMVEVTDPAGTVVETIDRNDIKGVERRGTTVRIKRRRGKDLLLEGATLDDAGRLEGALRAPQGQVTPVVAQKGGGIGRVFKWGCGGLVALFVIIVIAVVAAGSGGNDKQPSSGGGTTNAPSTVRTNEAMLAAGQSATAEGIRVTIVQMQDPYVSPNQFSRPSAGNRFVAFKVQIENVGGGSRSANAFNFKLLDGENFQHQIGLVTFTEQSLVGQATELGSNAKVEGWVGFEVKEGVGLKQLTYDPNPFTETDIVFRAP